jgi:hypothetical protein
VRTVTYKTVQDKANLLFAGKINATADDAASLNRFINSRYREFFERFYWPEWTVVERRTFRPQYDGTTAYAASTATAPVEVYYWPTQSYYQSLRAQPLTITTLTRSGTTATATIGAGHNLTTGDDPRITVSGVSPSGYNGTWNATVTGATTFTYVMPADPGSSGSGTMLAGINPADAGNQTTQEYWAVGESRYAANDWAAAAAYVVGNQVYQPLDGRFYQCLAAHTNQQPPNATYWGVLTPFERNIDLDPGATSNQGASATRIGEVKGVWNDDPWVVEDAGPQSFDLTYDGLVVRGSEPVVWVEFRLRPNDFTGSVWASGSFVIGDQVYYTTTGEYYVCIQPATTQAPTDTAYWTKLDFPYVLKDAVAQAAYADLLKVTGKTSKWNEELREAHRLLQREFDKIERLQGQTRSLNVQMR